VRSLISSILCSTAFFCAAAAAETAPHSDSDAGDTKSWYVQAGAYTHYSDNEEYDDAPLFGGLERHDGEKNTLIGFSVFNNSFGDFSQYLYWGKQWHPSKKLPAMRLKLTIGVVHGYEGEHQDVTPLYWGDAWGFGAVPTIGYQENRVGFDLALLGDSGILFLLGYKF
jgi:hypothetical protein